MAYTTIDDPSAYFKVQLYTGNGSANHAITFDDTDTDMQPDLVWIKNRDAADSNCLFDAVRGATELIHTDTNIETTTDADTLDAFQSDGFQVDADVKVNTNAEKYVAWCWKGGTTSVPSGGTITPSGVNLSAASGLFISKYTGTGSNGTIAHGLGTVPGLVIGKRIAGDTGDWNTWCKGLTSGTYYVNFNVDSAETGWTTTVYTALPTSTLINIGTYAGVNASSHTYMQYVFASVQGYSKMGTYEGNGNADGTFVYTGFRPAFVMTKSIDSSSAWEVFDNKREGYNVDNDALTSNENIVEATADQIDLLSNGFKLRIATDPNVAESYFYAAFAEAPFVNSNGVPNNAR